MSRQRSNITITTMVEEIEEQTTRVGVVEVATPESCNSCKLQLLEVATPGDQEQKDRNDVHSGRLGANIKDGSGCRGKEWMSKVGEDVEGGRGRQGQELKVHELIEGQRSRREDMAEGGDGSRNDGGKGCQKSYFDVLGICCTSEVPLIEKMLGSLDGVMKVQVIVPSKTVIVVHDSHLISQLQIVKTLNQAKLEATIRTYGNGTSFKSWPSKYTLACSLLLVLSLLGLVYEPLHWLALAAIAVGIPPMLLRSVASIRRCNVDIDILMLIAVAGSIALKDYWEGGVIVVLFSLSEWLNSRATYEANAVMASLANMIPQKAVLADSGVIVDARSVEENTVLAVKTGEVIPIDGVVVEGSCEVDESSLTGESFPVAKHLESRVFAGTHNLNGYINFRTTALADNSAVAKMTKLVEEAQNSKSRMNRIVDSCAKYYMPVIICASAAVAVVPAAMRLHNLGYWFRLALVLLVSACPCALVLSTPVATFCALTKMATTGLLIKGGDYLEVLAKTKVVAFDKTGTLTRGEFSVMDFHSVKDGIDKNALLYWVSSIESKSIHPMSSALVDYARSFGIEPKPDDVSNFQTFPGEGVYGEISGKKVHIGNRRISGRTGCKAVGDAAGETKGVTIGYMFSASELVGWFSLSDICRTGATEAIKDLKGLKSKVVMLTGDSNKAATHVQSQVGGSIDSIHAELLPEDKVGIINKLKKEEGTTVMVGDGINDAPALIAADVGISMGISGSTVAMETSHVTMMSNDIRKIPKMIRLAKRTKWKIIQNIVLSISSKAAILAVAFAGHPLLWAAVFADVGTCLLVTLNSMTLLRQTKHKAEKCCKSSHASHTNGHSMPHGRNHDHCHHEIKDQHHNHCHGSHDRLAPREEEHHDHCHHGTKDHCHNHQHVSHNGLVHKGEEHHDHGHCGGKLHHEPHGVSGNGCGAGHHHGRSHEVKGDGNCSSESACNGIEGPGNLLPSSVPGCGHIHSGLKPLENAHAIQIADEATQYAREKTCTCKDGSLLELMAMHDEPQKKADQCCRVCRNDCRETKSCCEGNIPHLPEIITE